MKEYKYWLRSLALTVLILAVSACGSSSPAGSANNNIATSTAGGLQMSCTGGTVYVGSTITCTSTGGSGNYNYSLSQGSSLGSIGSSNGIFTATGVGSVSIAVQDMSLGYTASYSFYVYSNGSSSSSGTLTVAPTTTGTVYVGYTVNFTTMGGSGNYSYSLTSGTTYGAINSSTGVFTASAVGTVTVQSYDNSTGRTGTYTLTVFSSNGTTGSCVSLASPSVVSSSSINTYADMTNYSQLNSYVANGVGLRFYNGEAVGIYMHMVLLNSDGTLKNSDSYSLSVGSIATTTSSMGQIYAQLPDDYLLYGIGVSSDSYGDIVQAIKLYGVKWDSGGSSTTIQCVADRYGNGSCASYVGLSGSDTNGYAEYVGPTNQTLRGIGVDVSNATVDGLWIKSAGMQSVCN